MTAVESSRTVILIRIRAFGFHRIAHGGVSPVEGRCCQCWIRGGQESESLGGSGLVVVIGYLDYGEVDGDAIDDLIQLIIRTFCFGKEFFFNYRKITLHKSFQLDT